MTVTLAEVHLWGSRVGAIKWDIERALASYEYDRSFQRSGIELAPLHMALGPGVFSFPVLSRDTFKGLPGMLADALPDRFGTVLIDAWLAAQGRTAESFSPIERLCYVGSRGMGALEFAPAVDRGAQGDSPLDIAGLVDLAQRALSPKRALSINAAGEPDGADLTEIIRVGTSAGGARAKAVVAWNEHTGEIRSGQIDQPHDYSHWLIKFDGVDANRDKELNDPLGFGRVEQAYADMARAAGIALPRTRLLEEGGRAHFMTERFDRVDGDKLHMQTLAAIAHFDFNLAGAYSYEQALQVMRVLRLPHGALVEQVRRAVFNVVARNQDDHTKNISFLMNRTGKWSLSPGYDITYSHNPAGAWTSNHQMTINAKRNDFERADLVALGHAADLGAGETQRLIEHIVDVVADWNRFATAVDVEPSMADSIGSDHRLYLATA